MKMALFNFNNGTYAGEVEIPDDVIEAAIRVHYWLAEQPRNTQICGVKLAFESNGDNDGNDNTRPSKAVQLELQQTKKL